MKKSFLFAAIGLSLACAASAQAGGAFAGGAIGGAIGVYGGTVTGGASSVTSGSSVAATQVNGYGSSSQLNTGYANGSAFTGGSIGPSGAIVSTSTTQAAGSFGSGSISGNVPIMDGSSIINGNGGISKADTNAFGSATFGVGQIGGFAAIGAIGGSGAF